MKACFLGAGMLVMLLSFSAKGYAECLPFLEIGRVWIMASRASNDPSIVEYNKISVVGEEAIGEWLCKKLVSVQVTHGEDGWEDIGDQNSEGVYYLYEDNGAVYHVWPTTGEIDRIVVKLEREAESGIVPGEHMKIFQIETAGANRLCNYMEFAIDDIGYVDNLWILEGIGASASYQWQPYHSFPPGEPEKHWFYYSYMLECYQGDELIFTKEAFDNLPKSAVADSVDMQESDGDGETALYDLSGMPQPYPQKGRIYVTDKKKLILTR